MPESAGLGPARRAGPGAERGRRPAGEGQPRPRPLGAYRGHSSMRNARGARPPLPQAACCAPGLTFTARLSLGADFFFFFFEDLIFIFKSS